MFITKNPITLKLLPDCYLTSKFLGANFTGKDLLLGFDLYRENKCLVTAQGIKSKKFFKPYIEIPKLYMFQANEILLCKDQLKDFQNQIIHELCASNHQEFLQKCDHPLWENPEFISDFLSKRMRISTPPKQVIQE